VPLRCLGKVAPGATDTHLLLSYWTYADVRSLVELHHGHEPFPGLILVNGSLDLPGVGTTSGNTAAEVAGYLVGDFDTPDTYGVFCFRSHTPVLAVALSYVLIADGFLFSYEVVTAWTSAHYRDLGLAMTVRRLPFTFYLILPFFLAIATLFARGLSRLT
jgi:hypothetical protein